MKPFWRLILTASAMVVIAGFLALALNALRPQGIPLIRSREAIADPDSEQRIITLSRAWELFEDGAVFVDSRTLEEYDEGHIKGARLLYYEHVEEDWETVIADVEFDYPIVSYCSGEGCNSSFIVADFLERVGYDQVYIFDGGWPQWSRAGYPLVGQAATPVPLYQ